MKRKIIIFFLILIAIGFLIWFFLRKKDEDIQTIDVFRQTLTQTVSSTGELVAQSEINLNFEIAGRVEKVVVKENSEIAEGELIAKLENGSLSQEESNAKAGLDQALAQSGLSDEEIQRLKSQVKNAEKFLSDTKILEDQKLDAAKQSENDHKRYYEDALDYYNQIVKDEGKDSSAAKAAKLTLNSALTNLNSAKENRQSIEKSKDLAITTAKNNLESAAAQLEKISSKSQQDYDNSVIQAAKSRYELVKSNLEKTFLKAPLSGIITKINYEPGEVISSSGNFPFAQMIANELIIESNISESDIAKVKVGNEGIITFDSLSQDEKFKAQVVSIDAASTVIQDVVYYKVKFRLETSLDPRLKSGMTANIDIMTSKKENVLVIPERLVKERQGKKYVAILDENSQVKEREIKTGVRGDEGLIEIISGLKEGDRLISELAID